MRPIPVTTLSRLEYIGSIDYAANQPRQLPTEGGNLPRDRYLYALLLRIRGRLTMPASGGPTGLLADGPYQLVDRVTIEGYHQARQQVETFYNLRGAEIYMLQRLYQVAPFAQEPAAWSFSGSATNDFNFVLLVLFPPYGVSPFEQLGYLLDTPLYNPIKLTVRWGDVNSVVNSYTNAPTLSAYGSASGVPTCEVSGIFAQAGASRFAGAMMGKVWRYTQDVTGSPVTTTATGVRLIDLPKGHYLRHVAVRTGAVATGTSAGNFALATLGDFLSEIRLYRGLNTVVRYIRRPQDLRDQFSMTHNVQPAVGWLPLDFAMFGLLGESFSARGIVAGPSGSVDFYLAADVAGNANQVATFTYEEIRNLPVRPGR